MEAYFRTPPSPAELVARLTATAPQIVSQLRLGGSTDGDAHCPGLATGFAVLDAWLPWGGWPVGAMTEILTEQSGIGELSLLLPAMSRLAAEKRPIVLVGPPHELFAPALIQAGVDPRQITQIHPGATKREAKTLPWSSEQILRSGTAALVLLWSTAHADTVTPEVLRRLHLACLGKPTTFIHYRAACCSTQPSPAWLRFGLSATDDELHLQLFKCRGRPLARPLISLDRAQVQARLGAHLRARKALGEAMEAGLTPVTDLAFPRQAATTDVALQ
ncbi:MAG: translesion DNA synthesis-associated protein ImuA [Casimicrobiaceae bacterium]